MRLERLEIAGFKSFSDRSELAFDEGVTAIVGPNGCGKSNVADAITWVLGEQSAKSLRGEKMEDVIFGGSDARKPTGAAEVRLRLSGVTTRARTTATATATATDTPTATATTGTARPSTEVISPAEAVLAEFRPAGRDVELVRRLYRSGESEYLIDGAQCRLRDIHELLMDTGLGAKAYAIIEQGKIGLILSLAAHRSAHADRGSRRHHQVQGAAPVGRVEARSRPAEPHAHRRHRLRSRQAARQSEAPGRQGAASPAPARRAAPLGEGAVCAAVPRARRTPSSRRAPGWPTRASARRRPQARLAQVEGDISRLAHRGGRGRLDGHRRARPRARARARDPAHAAAGRAQPPAGRDARRPHRRSRRRAGQSRRAARAAAAR